MQELSLKVCSQDLVSRMDQITLDLSAKTCQLVQPVRGATPYEIVYGKSYKGLLAEFGEPVHGYIKSLDKGEARWHLCLFLGKVERQDTDGVQVVLSKHIMIIERTDQDLSKYLPTCKSFNAFSWECQTSSADKHSSRTCNGEIQR